VVDSAVIDIQASAANIINQIAIALRTGRIHSTDNVAFTDIADKLIVLINEQIEQDDNIILQLRGDFFYLGDERVRYSPKHLLNFDYLSEEFKKIELGTVIIKQKLSVEEIKIFINSFIETNFLHESFEDLEEKLSTVSNIELKKLEEIGIEGKSDVRRSVRKTYFNAVFYVKGVINKVKAGEEVNIKKAKRVITSIVNTIVDHEQTLLGMTTIKDHDEYTYFHSANVSILSVSLGQHLGLNRKMLIDLGIAALFHDIGKTDVPNEILNKPTDLIDSEWRIMRKHPTWGVKSLLKMRDIDELTIRSAFAAFEHHMNLDNSGYPRLKTPAEMDLFSKIVTIADRYDAMTSARVYTRTPLTAEKSLSILMELSGQRLDSLILKYFVNMMGIYPIGSLVKLDSNELGLVFENNQQSLSRPRVMLITDSKGSLIEGTVTDLTEMNDENKYARTITKIMDPKKYGINIAEYLL
jgi:HD-GYP domain-containing protein (c-di-GMP phosphodiesterase class II)